MVRFYWPFVEKYIADAVKHCNSEMDIDDVLSFLEDGRAWMMVVGSPVVGIAVCELVIYPRKRTLRVILLAGDHFDLWKKQMGLELDEWARKLKADGIEAFVRPGFRKLLEAEGAQLVQLKMWRRLNG